MFSNAIAMHRIKKSAAQELLRFRELVHLGSCFDHKNDLYDLQQIPKKGKYLFDKNQERV